MFFAFARECGLRRSRPVARSEPDRVGTRSASKTGRISTVLRRASSGRFSTESNQAQARCARIRREPRVHRYPQRRDVLAGLAEHHPALDAGKQPRGQDGRLGVRAQLPALAHPLQRAGQQPFPGVEPGGGLDPRVLVVAGDLGGQRPDRAPRQARPARTRTRTPPATPQARPATTRRRGPRPARPPPARTGTRPPRPPARHGRGSSGRTGPCPRPPPPVPHPR